MNVASLAIEAFAKLVTSQPTLKQIVDYKAPHELVEQVYALIASEKAGTISQEERHELDQYEAIEHILICAKAEALHKMQAQAS